MEMASILFFLVFRVTKKKYMSCSMSHLMTTKSCIRPKRVFIDGNKRVHSASYIEMNC